MGRRRRKRRRARGITLRRKALPCRPKSARDDAHHQQAPCSLHLPQDPRRRQEEASLPGMVPRCTLRTFGGPHVDLLCPTRWTAGTRKYVNRTGLEGVARHCVNNTFLDVSMTLYIERGSLEAPKHAPNRGLPWRGIDQRTFSRVRRAA